MKNVLLQSIGVGTDVEATLKPIGLKSQDRFLLCSDGLWGEVGDRAIAEVLGRAAPSGAVAELVDLANANGGSDNVTVQIAALLVTTAEPARPIDTNARPEALETDTPTSPPREQRRWTVPGVIAASLLVVVALFWRVCA